MNRASNRHWTEEEARQVLSEAEREGRSITELARELRVSPQKLYWWRRRLHEDEKAREPRFMEVKVATQAQAKPFGVQTRSGHTIAVWPGFDASELRRLLAAVEDMEC
jgi:transposase-like protein